MKAVLSLEAFAPVNIELTPKKASVFKDKPNDNLHFSSWAVAVEILEIVKPIKIDRE